ncbi:hypothetical protein SAMN02745866_04058 [Alteromonadaceae bacterium Bs31]|nr:hypothetical protein SAMN02745866_04058 [Alteromonadaceae bacterium Bs31]
MFKAIWMLLSTPFKAVFTGRYREYSVSRNPFKWVGVFVWGIFLIPFTLFIYPIFVGLSLVGFYSIGKNGLSATILEDKIEVSSKNKGIVNYINIVDVKNVITKFDPPIIFAVIVLKNDERIELRAGTYKSFVDHCKTIGIEVNETPDIYA